MLLTTDCCCNPSEGYLIRTKCTFCLSCPSVTTSSDSQVTYLQLTSSSLGTNASAYSLDFQRQRGRKYQDNRLRLLTCIFEAVTERIFGTTFHLSNSKHYRDWLRQTRHNWQTSIIEPSYDLSTQSTGSTLSSDVETLSRTLDSSQAISHSQDNRQVWTSSDSTLPINSQESLPSNPMETTGPPMSAQMTAIVNYVNKGGGGVHKRREVERLTFSLTSSESTSDVSDTTRPARRRRIIHDSPSPLIYRHTPTKPTQNDSGHA